VTSNVSAPSRKITLQASNTETELRTALEPLEFVGAVAGEHMRYTNWIIWMMVAAVLVLSRIAQSQASTHSLVVNGGGSVPITQLNGRNYVDVEALARAANGSICKGGEGGRET
jgi:hypothetical protein